jgi:hypothetical protein
VSKDPLRGSGLRAYRGLTPPATSLAPLRGWGAHAGYNRSCMLIDVKLLQNKVLCCCSLQMVQLIQKTQAVPPSDPLSLLNTGPSDVRLHSLPVPEVLDLISLEAMGRFELLQGLVIHLENDLITIRIRH